MEKTSERQCLTHDQFSPPSTRDSFSRFLEKEMTNGKSVWGEREHVALESNKLRF